MREAFKALGCVLVYPILSVMAAVLLVRCARRREGLLHWHDLRWLSRRGLLAVGALLTFWIVGAVIVAVTSIFVSVPDI